MKILLLDIETAPNRVFVWGLFNQNVAINQIDEAGYTLSWAAKWLDDKHVMYSDINDGKPAMLGKIYALLDEADVVVHYNGSNFDMPTLNKEFAELGWSPPAPYQQIDLLQVVRKRFRFPSNKLDYVAQALGLGKKYHHKGMELWRGCMEGNKDDWESMELYNKQDVKLLEKLYIKLKAWIANHPNFGLFVGDTTEPICPNCGSNHLHRRGYHVTKTLTYQRYRCSDCGSWSRERKTNTPKEVKANVVAGI